MTDINAAAAAARENARTSTGQFGEQEHSAPELSLVTPYVPGQPVYATVTFELYESEHDEHPVEVSAQKVDIARVLDTMPLEDVVGFQEDPTMNGEGIFYALQSAGELTHPDHPFVVNAEPEDIRPYSEYRENLSDAGPLSAQVAPSVENLLAALTAHGAAISSLRQQLEEAEAEKEKAEQRILSALAQQAVPGASQIVVQLDHHRYPVEVYDHDGKWVDLGEEGEQRLVDEIRSALGDDPASVGGRGTARVVDIDDA